MNESQKDHWKKLFRQLKVTFQTVCEGLLHVLVARPLHALDEECGVSVARLSYVTLITGLPVVVQRSRGVRRGSSEKVEVSMTCQASNTERPVVTFGVHPSCI